jgi:hypothetical protein
MTSISELAARIQEDNGTIIKNQDEANKSLDNLDKNFGRFFSIQERSRLDRLEDKLDRNRKLPTRGGGKGILAGVGAAASKFNPLSFLAGLTPMAIVKGILAAAGFVFRKAIFTTMYATGKAIQNALADNLDTQRKMNRLAIKDLARAEGAEAKRVKAERAEIIENQKKIQADRKAALREEKFRQQRFQEADKSFKNRSVLNANALDADAKFQAKELAEKEYRAARKARIELEQIERGNKADIQNKKQLQKEYVKEQKRLNKLARLGSNKVQRGLLSSMNGFDVSDLPQMGDPVASGRTVRTGQGGSVGGDPVASGRTVRTGQGGSVVKVPRAPFAATISNVADTPSQKAALKLISPSYADDLARAGFEAVDTGKGVRFRAIGKPTMFIKATDVLDQVDRVRLTATKTKTANNLVRGVGKTLSYAAFFLEGTSGIERARLKAEKEGRVVTSGEATASGLTSIVTSTISMFEDIGNWARGSKESGFRSLGYNVADGALGRKNSGERIYGGVMNLEERFSTATGIGEGEANKKVLEVSTKTQNLVDYFISELVNVFSGEKLSGVTADAAARMGGTTPVIVDSSVVNNSSSSLIVANEASTSDNLNGGGFNIIGGGK